MVHLLLPSLIIYHNARYGTHKTNKTRLWYTLIKDNLIFIVFAHLFRPLYGRRYEY